MMQTVPLCQIRCHRFFQSRSWYHRFLIGSACLFGLLYLVMPPVWAQPEFLHKPLQHHEAKQGSFFYTNQQDSTSHRAPLLKTTVTMQVTGLIARATVQQEFMNPTQTWVEGVYVFPLPDDAAVDHVRMKIGDRVIEGDIQEKAQAKKTYNKARKEGKRASLVEQERPNIFTTSVANMGPGEHLRIEIEYQQTVAFDQGSFRLRFPLVVGPRYIPGEPLSTKESTGQPTGYGWARNTDQVLDAARVTPPVIPPKDQRENLVHISINLAAGVPLSNVYSTYHPIQVSQKAAGTFEIQLQDKQIPADRDFELTWSPVKSERPRAVWFTENKEGETYLLLMMFPPMLETKPEKRQQREMVFVIDTSGSMHGTSLRQAQAALTQALERLSAEDTFNIIQFNDRTSSLFTHSQPATSRHRSQAIRYIQGLLATGGTEMLSAVRMALETRTESKRLRQIIFMTDGQIGNEKALFTSIVQRLGESRLFTVGIGSAPNSHFMHKAASFGRGTFTHIGKVQEVEEKMQGLLAKLEHPVLKDITLTRQGWDSAEVFPEFIPDLYRGDPVVLAVKTKGLPSRAQLSGFWGDKPWNQVTELESSESREGIATLWARRKISSLMDRAIATEPEMNIRDMVVSVALHHHLVSPYTSLVAVDRTPVRPLLQPVQTRAIPTHLPQGQSHIAIFGLPQTATWGSLQLLCGVMLILISGMLWSVRRYVE